MNFINKLKEKIVFIIYKFLWKINIFKKNNVCFIITNEINYEMIKNIQKNLDNSYFFPATWQAKKFFKKNNIPHKRIIGFPKIIVSPGFLMDNQRYVHDLTTSTRAIISIKEVKKIQTYHGVIDKNWTYSKSNHNYDLFLVPGKYAKDRLLEIGVSNSKIKITGFTKFSHNFNKKILLPHKNKIKVILYAPTHGVISSLPFMLKSLVTLKDTYRVIFKPHNCTREEEMYVNLLKNLEIETYEENDNIEHLFSISDILISDTSSIMFEFLLTKKPVIALDFNTWITKGNSVNSKSGPETIFRNIFFRVDDPSNIEATIENALKNYDYKKSIKILNKLFDNNSNPGKKAALEIIKFSKLL